MREILFRGKTSDGEWVEGYYSNLGGNHPRVLKENIFIGKIGRVLEFENIDVLPETVGQYTGLTDKNGVKIFEGDILQGEQYPFKSDGEYNYFAEVCYWDNAPEFGIYTFKNPKADIRGISEGNTDNMQDWKSRDWEIIGNIHDNPELLETAAKPIDKIIAQNGLAPATENFELMEG